MERSYTVKEIDRMRDAIEFHWLYGMKPSEAKKREKYSLTSRLYYDKEKICVTEERLRTYILAGIDPEELE